MKIMGLALSIFKEPLNSRTPFKNKKEEKEYPCSMLFIKLENKEKLHLHSGVKTLHFPNATVHLR
jgi:hypothetical protein